MSSRFVSLYLLIRCFLVAEPSPMSAPSSLNVLINPQSLNQAVTVASASCGNVIYMIRGAKSENGNQIVIQNTQELLNLLNKNNARFSINQSLSKNNNNNNSASALADVELRNLTPESHVNNSQTISKDGRFLIKTLEKSHSFFVVRNSSSSGGVSGGSGLKITNPISLAESKYESKEEFRTKSTVKAISSHPLKISEGAKDNNENVEVQIKHVPIGSGELQKSQTTKCY